MHLWSVLIIVQRDATQSSLFINLQVHSTCFGCQPHPSSGVHKTVTTASGTGRIFCAATSLQRGQLATLEGGSCTVPEAVVTVLCTPDDGCGWHPKHVEWTRIINRLLCVASRWTIINIYYWYLPTWTCWAYRWAVTGRNFCVTKDGWNCSECNIQNLTREI